LVQHFNDVKASYDEKKKAYDKFKIVKKDLKMEGKNDE